MNFCKYVQYIFFRCKRGWGSQIHRQRKCVVFFKILVLWSSLVALGLQIDHHIQLGDLLRSKQYKVLYTGRSFSYQELRPSKSAIGQFSAKRISLTIPSSVCMPTSHWPVKSVQNFSLARKKMAGKCGNIWSVEEERIGKSVGLTANDRIPTSFPPPLPPTIGCLVGGGLFSCR